LSGDSTDAALPALPAGRELPPLRKELAPGLAITAATLVVELGVFFLAWSAGAGLRQAALAALMVAAVWTALAAPIFAAGARGALRSLIRAGLVADATFVAMLIIWMWWKGHFQDEQLGEMSFGSVLKAYCTVAAMAVLSAGAVNLPRCVPGRHIAAVVVAVCMMLALASPLWCGGLIASTHGQARSLVADLAVWLNPFYSVTASMIDSLNYVIQQEGLMYQLTLIGDYVAAPSCPWYVATVIYLPVGIILLVIGKARPQITHPQIAQIGTD
jgi:hypothetical protein